jgi:type IV pilus assembly protein PilE
MRFRRRQRGFTLVELATVLVIVAVLATLAFVMYRRHVKAAHMSEATQISGSIRAGQNAYKAENGLYADVSTDTSSFYPSQNPGAFATQWGGPCSACNKAEGWRDINVNPGGPVMFGYATVAGVGAAAVSPKVGAPKAPSSMAALKGPASGGLDKAIGATDPFFTTVAWGDTDGDGNATVVMSYSHTSEIIVLSDGD